jgi:hypothetical protein
MSNTMIPSNPSKTSVRRYVANIVKTYNVATADQRARGAAWYVTAHELAGIIAGGDFRMGAGVIAALSANKSWPENQRLATNALATGNPSGHVGNAIEKATRILNGADPEKVLPMDAKTGNFYLCILDPNHPTAVCVDRHAHDVAVGRRFGNDDRGLSSKSRYNALADAYRIAARKLELNPATLQAITWVVQIESIRRVDAYGYGG